MTHQPMVSMDLPRGLAESVPPEAVVPFGKVPLMKRVSVPLTVAVRTRVLFKAAALPFPTKPSKYVVSLLSSHPQTLYCWHKHLTALVWFCPAVRL
jgi:hypothetical protein